MVKQNITLVGPRTRKKLNSLVSRKQRNGKWSKMWYSPQWQALVATLNSNYDKKDPVSFTSNSPRKRNDHGEFLFTPLCYTPCISENSGPQLPPGLPFQMARVSCKCAPCPTHDCGCPTCVCLFNSISVKVITRYFGSETRQGSRSNGVSQTKSIALFIEHSSYFLSWVTCNGLYLIFVYKESNPSTIKDCTEARGQSIEWQWENGAVEVSSCIILPLEVPTWNREEQTPGRLGLKIHFQTNKDKPLFWFCTQPHWCWATTE